MLNLLNIPVLFGNSLEAYAIMLVISIPTYFAWRWLLKKFIKDNQRRIIFSCFLTIIVTPIIYSGLIVLLIISWTYERSIEFNKSKWLEDKETRYEMADDLIHNKLLIGKDSVHVINIIGNPSWKADSLQQWNYHMGTKADFGFTFHTLKLTFRNNKVFSVVHGKYHD